MYEKTPVPLDGSKTAETVLPNVVRLARESKAKVVLFTADAPVTATGSGKTRRESMSNGSATIEKPNAAMKAYKDSQPTCWQGWTLRRQPSWSTVTQPKRYWPVRRQIPAT